MYKYFSESDFKKADPPCSLEQMKPELMEMLDAARFRAGIPFKINSAFRSFGHEILQGRDGSSSHTKGIAVDISATDSTQRFVILEALIHVGFTRLGIHKSFIHCDIDQDKTEDVAWLYK